MGGWGWWASTGGQYGLGDVTESSYSPINYLVPFSQPESNPPITTTAEFAPYDALRVNAYGSSHEGGGANSRSAMDRAGLSVNRSLPRFSRRSVPGPGVSRVNDSEY